MEFLWSITLLVLNSVYYHTQIYWFRSYHKCIQKPEKSCNIYAVCAANNILCTTGVCTNDTVTDLPCNCQTLSGANSSRLFLRCCWNSVKFFDNSGCCFLQQATVDNITLQSDSIIVYTSSKGNTRWVHDRHTSDSYGIYYMGML